MITSFQCAVYKLHIAIVKINIELSRLYVFRLFRFARRKRKQQRKYIVAMVTALPQLWHHALRSASNGARVTVRSSPLVTLRGSRCAVVQLQMYTAEKDVITSKVSTALFSIYVGFNTWQYLQYVPGWCLATALTPCHTTSIRQQCGHVLHPTH